MQETETVLFAWITMIPGQGVLKLSSQDAGPSLEARPDSLVKSLSPRLLGTWRSVSLMPEPLRKGCGGRADFAGGPE